jgi:hypothetical protein
MFIRCVGVWSTLIDAVDCSDSGAVMITLIHGAAPGEFRLLGKPGGVDGASDWTWRSSSFAPYTCLVAASRVLAPLLWRRTYVGWRRCSCCVLVHWPGFCVASDDGL